VSVRSDPGLRERFVRHVRASGFFVGGDGPPPGEGVVVACSGGLDSCVLAHLLRFSPGLEPGGIVLAHLDHRMRPESEADARWLGGLARAWELPLRTGTVPDPPRSEAEGRRARYAFLRQVQREVGARWLVTAHHADDQAETVLFRILRGTGISGLRGIAEEGSAGLVRPLLPFRRHDLEAYARRWKVPAREDPSNREHRYARNVLRHEVLPRAEAAVAPGARRSLVRLARLARQEEAAWESLVPGLLSGVLVGAAPARYDLDRDALLRQHPAVRARLLRTLAARLSTTLGESGTRTALEFTSSGASGRHRTLAGGLVLAREFDRLVLSRPSPAGEDEWLEVAEPGEGRGTFILDGRIWRAEWTHAVRPATPWVQAFSPSRLAFPLRLRGWAPGDRIRMPYGSKKLKKVFAEARIPLGERARRPVLVDREGAVLWVPGLARAADLPEATGGTSLIFSVKESDTA
jgi:tRNA(Ile)-lysidine synthase